MPLQVGKPGEEQLRLWGHHTSTATVPDQARLAASCAVHVFSACIFVHASTGSPWVQAQ